MGERDRKGSNGISAAFFRANFAQWARIERACLSYSQARSPRVPRDPGPTPTLKMIPAPMALHPAAFALPLPVVSSPILSNVHGLSQCYHQPSIQLHFPTTKHPARRTRRVDLRDISTSGRAEQTATTEEGAAATGRPPAGALHPDLA